MENLLTVTLEAHNSKRNHHRLYQLMVGKDLLGHWTLTIRHGRIGNYGQLTRYSDSNQDRIKSLLSSKLKRRASAPRRIGCTYQLHEIDHASSLAPSDWLDLLSIESANRFELDE